MPTRTPKYPAPTMTKPSPDQIATELRGAVFEEIETLTATDGCEIPEPDGTCQHGHPTWLRRLGYI